MSASDSLEYRRVRVYVTAGARRTRLDTGKDGTYTASIREDAQGGRANEAVRQLLATHFDVPLAQVRILTGHRSRSKMIGIGN